MTPLSVIVPCYNEERLLEGCLASVRFADEILVVDSFSTDRTLEIARRHTDRILQHEFQSHGAQNNWAIPQAKHDWILVVDADEQVTPALAQEIQTLLPNPALDGYWLRRRNFFLGREMRHGSGAKDYVLRLFRRDKGRYQEQLVHSQVELTGRAAWCRAALLHYSYVTLDDYVRKCRRLIRGGALMALERGTYGSGGRMLAHALGRFVKGYVLRRGFLDGTAGFVLATLEAHDAFLKYAILWELQQHPGPPPSPGPHPCHD